MSLRDIYMQPFGCPFLFVTFIWRIDRAGGVTLKTQQELNFDEPCDKLISFWWLMIDTNRLGYAMR